MTTTGDKTIVEQAIDSVESGIHSFFRYITANDTGATGGHQAGFYIGKQAEKLLFDEPRTRGQNKEKWIEIKWQNDFVTQSRIVYYGKGTRDEYRITRFGEGFQFLTDENIGNLNPTKIVCNIVIKQELFKHEGKHSLKLFSINKIQRHCNIFSLLSTNLLTQVESRGFSYLDSAG